MVHAKYYHQGLKQTLGSIWIVFQKVFLYTHLFSSLLYEIQSVCIYVRFNKNKY